jgi:hypothetical protein
MRKLRTLGSALLVTTGFSLAVGVRPAAAAGEVTYDACVVERHPTAALMRLEGDVALFELDLRPVPGQPFALSPGDCVTVTGIDRDNQPGLRREFSQASWLVEAAKISDEKSHLNPSSQRRGKQDDD